MKSCDSSFHLLVLKFLTNAPSILGEIPVPRHIYFERIWFHASFCEHKVTVDEENLPETCSYYENSYGGLGVQISLYQVLDSDVGLSG